MLVGFIMEAVYSLADWIIGWIPDFNPIFETVGGFTALAEFIAYAAPFVPLGMIAYVLGIWFGINTLKFAVDALVWFWRLIPFKAS